MTLITIVAALLMGADGNELREYSVAFRPGSVTVEGAAQLGRVIRRENDLYLLALRPAVVAKLRKDNKRVLSLRDVADKPIKGSVKSLTAYLSALHFEEKAAKREFPGLGNEDNYLWYIQQRAYPKDSMDWSKYRDAAKHRDAMPIAASGPTDTSSWTYVGPTNLATPQRQFFGLAPLNGKITAAVSHPTDLNTAYVGSPMGGVWKTTDSGVNWTPLSEDWDFMGVSSMAINVLNTDYVYAGTGDFDGGLDYGHGIMYTTDAGSTWTETGATEFGTTPVSAITVDPEFPIVIMAATATRNSNSGGSIWRNPNAGLFGAWTSPIGTSAAWTDLKYGAWDSSIGARRYYAIGSNTTTNFFKMSTDRGLTWTDRNLPNGLARQDRMNIATSKLFPKTIYLLATTAKKIFKSADAGGTWTDITAGFPNGNATLGSTYNWSQSTFYDSDIETSQISNDVDVIYVGLIDIARSDDGGTTWESIGGRTYETDALTHNDQHVIANTADPNYMLVGNDGGAYHYIRAGLNNIWFYRSKNLGVVQFYHSAHHPTSLTKMLGGSQDNATPFANGNIASWGNAAGGDGAGCAIDPLRPDVQYANSQKYSFSATSGLCNIWQTTNAWASGWQFSFNPGSDTLPQIGVYELDPNNSLVGYFGTNFLWRFIYTGVPGFGAFQSRIGGNALATGSGVITSVSICASDSNTIYTGASSGEVFVTRDGGATAFRNITGSLPNRAIADVCVNPDDGNDVLVVLSGFGTGHVYHCENTSVASPVWTNVSGSGIFGLPDVPGNTIIRSIYDPETTWWVGTDIGTFLTASEGSGWLNITGLGMPNVQVNDLTFASGSSHVFAATFGRGMWHIEVFPPNQDVTDVDAPSSGTAGANIQGLVILDHPAPDTGTYVYLSSDNPALVPPQRVYVPFNQTQVQFAMTTRITSLQTVTATLTATLLSSTQTTQITLNPPNGLFAANQITVIEGDYFSGGLPDIRAMGGDGVSILSDSVTLAGRLELRGASPLATPGTMSFAWASSVGRPGLSETVQLFDTTTSQWVTIAGRIAPIANTYGLVSSVSSPSRFVNGSSNARAAFAWAPINDEDPSQDGWLQTLDFALWRVTP